MTARLALAIGALLVVSCVRAERIELRGHSSTCVVDTCGGRVCSYVEDGTEILWMPSDEPGGEACWRHGGIPIAWPWFGRLGKGDSHIHGYAWKSDFKVASRTANSAVLTFVTESAALEYTIRLDDALILELRTNNKSKFDFPVGVAFHPYFRVGERDLAIIEGYDNGPVPVTNAVDRSMLFGAALPRHECVIRDNARNLALRIVSEGATGLNLWNPGPEKRCPGLIPGDEWRRFVAVEPFAMGLNRFLVLAPGESHVLKMSVSAGIMKRQ